MTILFIDTSLGACRVAVIDKNHSVLAEHFEIMPRGQDQKLPLITDRVLNQVQQNFDALSGIIVTIGPGSFTGIRVGMAYAQGIACACDIPLQGVSSLYWLAHSVTKINAEKFDCIIPIKKDAWVRQNFATNTRKAMSSCSQIDPAQLLNENVFIPEHMLPDDNITVQGVPLNIAAVPCAVDNFAQEMPEWAHGDRPLYVRSPDVTLSTRS